MGYPNYFSTFSGCLTLENNVWIAAVELCDFIDSEGAFME